MANGTNDGDRPAPQRRAVTAATTIAALGCLVAGAGACGSGTGPTSDDGPTPPPASNRQYPPPGAASDPSPSAASTSPTDPAPDPAATNPDVDLADPATVPALDIQTDLEPLAVDDQNVLVPPDYGVAGWWEAGPEPGEPGAAVIAGHVDSVDGPDVFARLSLAEVGDQILVDLADGDRVIFTVVDVGQYPQHEFPTELVYGGSDERPLLRLITCGGEYDRDIGRYRDNVVVFAEPQQH